MEPQVKTKSATKGEGTGMQKIVPHLWFDKEAKEAAGFYESVFGGDSKVTSVTPINDTPSGDAEMVTFRLRGHDFMTISAGPIFKFNPSISFILNFDPSQSKNAREELDRFWAKISEGGTPLMPLGEYPFSKRYGWIKDKYGLTWQLILTNPEGEPRPFIIPSLLFTGEVQVLLQQIRATIKQAVPDAEETISYAMPAFKYNGILAYFAAFKNHIGFYALPSGNEAFKKELQHYKTGKGSIQFPLDKPMPLDLITRIVKLRANENLRKIKTKKK